MIEFIKPHPNGYKERGFKPKIIIYKDGSYKLYGKAKEFQNFNNWMIKKFGGKELIKNIIENLRTNPELIEELKEMGFEVEIQDD